MDVIEWNNVVYVRGIQIFKKKKETLDLLYEFELHEVFGLH